jgi:reactive intermediate/imine deaminase
MRQALVPLFALAAACGAAAQTPPPVEYFPVPGPVSRPFSEAVRVGDLLYLSGQLGLDSTGRLAPGGVQPETRQALENIRGTLTRLGRSMDDVVKCTVMLADMGQWARMNEVYVTFFPNHLPARSALGANGLALGAQVEIECLATAR